MRTPRLFGTLFPQWLWRLPDGKRQIALTFDDGPDPATTPALLDVLKSLEVRATFFLVGQRDTFWRVTDIAMRITLPIQ
jgi:peptidoglycan/xylan/chitin deacetylase (PgdA/CDA1 family)